MLRQKQDKTSGHMINIYFLHTMKQSEKLQQFPSQYHINWLESNDSGICILFHIEEVIF